MKVTVARLIKLKACQAQVDLFRSTFGEEVEVTEDACVQAVTAGISIDWGAKCLLNADQRQTYKDACAPPLRQAYYDARAPLLQAYNNAHAPLWQAYKDAQALLGQAYEDAQALLGQAYEDARAPIRQAYYDAHDPLLQAYKDARAPLLRAYEDARARAFFCKRKRIV